MKRLKELVKKAQEAMAFIEPTANQMKEIVAALRKQLGAETAQVPVWKKYLTYTLDTSNKYHYFAVFEWKDKPRTKWVAGNAHGRIGYRPQATTIGIFPDKKDAINAAEKKALQKMKKGYDVKNLK